MKLIDLCDPFFRYASALKRAARRGAPLSADAVRSELKKILKEMRAAAADPTLEDQFDKVELPLIFFIDFLILESRSRLAKEWEPLAYERNELAGDQKFFEMLEATLADESDAASERLVVYHSCLGLGFTGGQEEEPDTGRAYLSFVGAGESNMAKIKRRVYARARKALDIRTTEHLCPEAYEHIDRSSRIEDTGRKLMAMAITLGGLVLVLIIANFLLFRWTSTGMISVLDRIETRSGAPALTVQAEGPGTPPSP